jgi:hypothetical protein
MTIVAEIYAKDFKKDVDGFDQKPQCIEVPALPCSVKIELGDKVDTRDYDLLRSRLADAFTANQLDDKLCVKLHKVTKEFDDMIGALIVARKFDAVDKALSAYQKLMQKTVIEFEGEVSKVFVGIWKKFLEDHQKYKTYKFKAVIDFGVNVASLAGSIASLAASATPAAPVTAVMGTYGILKNTAKLCIQCRNLYIEAETLAKDVEADVATLKKKYDKVQSEVDKGTEKELGKAKKEKREVKAKEMAVAIGNKLFGDVVGMLVTSVDTTTKKNSQYGNKIRGVQEQTKAFAREHGDMVDNMQKLYDYVRELDDEYKVLVSKVSNGALARAELGKRQKKIKTAFDAWNGARKAMDTIRDQVQVSEKRYLTNLDKHKGLQKVIDDFEKEFKTKNWAEAGRWLGVAADVGLSIGPGGASAWESTGKIVESTMKLVVIAEKEVITELKNKM